MRGGKRCAKCKVTKSKKEFPPVLKLNRKSLIYRCPFCLECLDKRLGSSSQIIITELIVQPIVQINRLMKDLKL